MSCLHRPQALPKLCSGGGSVLGDLSHLCVCLLPESSGLDFGQVLSLSWGRRKRAARVCHVWSRWGDVGQGRQVLM